MTAFAVLSPITRSGTSSASWDGWELEEWRRTLDRDGAVVTETHNGRPFNHRLIGCGVSHNDAAWAETRFTEGSMAAYYENGERPRWWNTEGWNTEGVKYYGCRPRSSRLHRSAHAFARHDFLYAVGASHSACPYEYCESR